MQMIDECQARISTSRKNCLGLSTMALRTRQGMQTQQSGEGRWQSLTNEANNQNVGAMSVQDREHVVLPRQPDHTSEALLAKLSIAKVMDFTSQTLRSGVVVWSDDSPRGSALLFLRGAPAVIRGMVQPNTVPPDFNQVSSDYCLVG